MPSTSPGEDFCILKKVVDLDSKGCIINDYSGNVNVVPKGHWSDSRGFPKLNLS